MSSQKISPNLVPDPPDELSWGRRWGWCVVPLVLGLGGAWLRVAIACESLWLDELHTGYCVSGSLSEVAPRSLMGNQSPFYYWLCWLFYQTGISIGLGPELSIRSLSLIAGVFLLMIGGALVWNETKSRISVCLATAWLAFEPTLLFYSTEARPYVLVQLFGLVQAACFVSLLRNFRWSAAIPFVFLSAVVFYSHYTSACLFLFEVLVVCGWLWSQRGEGQLGANLKRWLGVLLLIAIVCSGALPHLLFVSERKSLWSLVSSGSVVMRYWLSGFACWQLPAVLCLVSSPSTDREAKTWDDPSRPGKSQIALLGFLVGWALIPCLVPLLMHTLGIAPVALVRYTQVGTIAFGLTVPFMLGRERESRNDGGPDRRVVARFIAMVVFAGMLVWQASSIWRPVLSGTVPKLRNENWAGAISEVNGSTEPGESVLLFLMANVLEDAYVGDDPDPAFQDYLKFPVKNIYPLDPSRVEIQVCPTLAAEPISRAQVQQVEKRGGCMLLIRAEERRAKLIVEMLRSRLSRPCGVLQYREAGSPLILYRLQLMGD